MYRTSGFLRTASTSGSDDAPGMPKKRLIPHAASSAIRTSDTVVFGSLEVVFAIVLHSFFFIDPHKRFLPDHAVGAPPVGGEVFKPRSRRYTGGGVSRLLIILVVTDTARPSRHIVHVPEVRLRAIPDLHV